MVERKTCPMCGEDISINAKKCPHCRELLDSVWRDGNILVMVKTAKLPARCIKSNQPAETYLPRTLYWHPSWIYILALPGLLLYALVALVVRKKAEITIGLTKEWARKRRTAIVIAWLLAFAGMGIIIAGLSLLKGDPALFTFLGGLTLIIGASIYGTMAAQMISPIKITDEHAWIKGVCPEFLAELPEYDG